MNSALRHLLSQVDGAAAVDARGEVVEIGLHLRASFEAETMVRVSSSKEPVTPLHSVVPHDLPTAVVFVMSDNGPVTVYVRGRTVASIELGAGLDRDEPRSSTRRKPILVQSSTASHSGMGRCRLSAEDLPFGSFDSVLPARCR